MVGWLELLLIAATVMIALWGLLVVLAARLPPGLLEDLAGFLPAGVTLVRRLRADPRVPWQAKAAVVLAGLWVLSPVDLLPEFLPVIGPWTTWSWSPWPSGMRLAGSPARCWRPGRANRGRWSGCSDLRRAGSPLGDLPRPGDMILPCRKDHARSMRPR
jgi:hypothetical protein